MTRPQRRDEDDDDHEVLNKKKNKINERESGGETKEVEAEAYA